ncbi:MAG: GIY-YIG nuclease family protein [Patescibacteria group bacterium]
MAFFVYILKSEKDNGLYVGMSQDVGKRLASHNFGSTRSTKYRRPLKVIYVEEYSTRVEARAREKFLKSYAGSSEKMSIVEHCGVV